jgi:hypothetical protein
VLISHERRFIFVHVWKTGGTSVRQALAPYCRPPARGAWARLWRPPAAADGAGGLGLSPHASAGEIRQALGPAAFAGYFTFAFVRNPWDWEVSWYHYVLGRPGHAQHALVRSLGGFARYLEWRAARPAVLQKDFVADPAGRLLVDFVGRFESLRADFRHACARIGVAAELPHANRSRRGDYRSYYDRRARELVGEVYREDVDFFGYRFEGGPACPAAAGAQAA